MQYSQKKPYKNFYNKSKTYDPEQLDQGSSTGHAFQNNYYKQNNFYKYSKTKKYYNEYNNYQSSSQTDRPNAQGDEAYHQVQGNLGQFDQWQHDKYSNETQRNLISERNKGTGRNDNKFKNKNDKRPDRQLYSAREKHGEDNKSEANFGEDVFNKGTKNSGIIEKPNFENSNLEEKSEKRNSQKGQNGSLFVGEETEIHHLEEDKSFVSNVSTAISERLKNSEEDVGSREKALSTDMTHNTKFVEQKALFQVVLYTERGNDKVKFYEDEEDLEQMLERVCKNNNINGRMNLYFKINILNMLKKFCASNKNRARVEAALEKYEDENARLVFYESGFGEVHKSIKKYIQSPNLQAYEGFYQSPNPKYK